MVSVMFCVLFLKNKKGFMLIFNMLDMGTLKLDLCMFMDWMSLLFFTVLCVMVSCVLKFSCIYMEKDLFETRFTWLVLSFVFSMGCLIFLPHFFFLLVGWDGLGMTSFLLVIYYLSDSSWAAGMKTYLMNRMGDGFFMLAMVLFLFNGHWDMNSLVNNEILSLIVVLGCFTKSAQFPFSSWLPAAMAAPTPVSSLVHSSTLVTAGIYLMMRFCHMFPSWLFMLMGMMGLWTLYTASLAACCEFDGKKVVAYSTLSQLGLMTVAMSLNLPMMAFFHLLTHAMFKALMFMCVGFLIKKSGHFQDLRSLKGLWSSSPLLAITLLVSSFSLLGFPFLSGFFSKELMMENDMLMVNWVFHLLLLFSLPFTSYYSCRLSFKMLNGVKYKSVLPNTDSNVPLFSLLPLYLGSICLGSLMSPYFYSLSSIYPCHMMKFMVSLLMLSGGVLSWYDVKIKKNSFIWFCSTLGYLTPFNSSFFKKNLVNTGSYYFCLLDQGILGSFADSLDKGITNTGSWLNSSLNYFSFPQVGYYMANVLGMSLFVGAAA